MQDIIDRALTSGREILFEHELLDAFGARGLPVPAHCFIACSQLASLAAPALGALSGGRGVLKVVSPQILHKSDLGGVVFLPEVTVESVRAAAERIEHGVPPELRPTVEGYVLEQALTFEAKLGHELLIGVRQSPDFGPVYTIGFGGTYVEALAAATREDQATVLYHPGLSGREVLREKLERALFFRWATGSVRGVRALCSAETLFADICRWIDALEEVRAAVQLRGRTVAELELNPLVFSEGCFRPVDALLRLGGAAEPVLPFPVAQLREGLVPQSVALIGVSTGMNMGRIILRSVLDGGFDPTRISVVRAGVEQIDGVSCVPSVAALPAAVDLLVLAVPAAAVPELLAEIFEQHKAKTVLLIPGGMGETEGGQGIAAEVAALLARHGDDPLRPVLVGNNSVGIVSRPARFDSLFIPKEKLPRRSEGLSQVAFISQSGAFMLTQLGKLDFITPDFQLSIGNQIDARLSHFAAALRDRDDLTSFAFYVEGLKAGDGMALAEVIRELRAMDKDVVVYKAGRSALGQAATMGHTASVAGDRRVFAQLLRDAGAQVTESFADFLDLVRLSVMLKQKRFAGPRVAFVSNAGYETVGMADASEGEGFSLEAATLGPARAAIAAALEEARIGALVNVANPLDLTPMADDAVHARCIAALLDDPGVDLGVFGCVPYTPAVQTLPPGLSPKDVFDAPAGYAARLVELAAHTDKPFVVVIDAGSHYDPLCGYLQDRGVPCFRDADRAVRALARYARSRLSAGSRSRLSAG